MKIIKTLSIVVMAAFACVLAGCADNPYTYQRGPLHYQMADTQRSNYISAYNNNSFYTREYTTQSPRSQRNYRDRNDLNAEQKCEQKAQQKQADAYVDMQVDIQTRNGFFAESNARSRYRQQLSKIQDSYVSCVQSARKKMLKEQIRQQYQNY